jgi:hypothetical protein
MIHLKLLEKQEKAKPRTSRRREMLKIRDKIDEIETTTTKKSYKESMNQEVGSLKK